MSQWAEVSNNHPCPVCGGKKWCAVADNGAVVKCMREPDGCFKQGNDGSGEAYFHRMGEEVQRKLAVWVQKADTLKKPHKGQLELDSIFADSQRTSHLLSSLSKELGLSVNTLARLGTGWLSREDLYKHGTKCSAEGAFTFPMKDADGDIVGFRLRVNGFKYSLKGGWNGMFIPTTVRTGSTLTIVEGPTDTAAALCYGANAIGRPNNNAMTRELASLMAKYRPSKINIVIDNDPDHKTAAATLLGARALQQMAVVYTHVYPTILKPRTCKDVRDMWRQGASPEEELMEIGYE
jgi:phage/plasmid primase-like uncharacterized protein